MPQPLLASTTLVRVAGGPIDVNTVPLQALTFIGATLLISLESIGGQPIGRKYDRIRRQPSPKP